MPSPAPNTCWLYLIRHGATPNNREVPPRLQGRRTDPGLSDEGFEQARLAAAALADRSIDAVFATPLLRAQQTAEAIAQPHGLPVAIVDDLIEVDVGEWEGVAWDEIEKNHPEAYRLFMTDASIHPYLGGENMTTVYDRVLPAFEQLMRENVGRTIVAVAHNVVNRVYLTHLLHMPLKKYRSVPQDNCGINVLRYRDGEIKAVTVNSIEHFGGKEV